MSLAIYRKYRPKSFFDLIGQEHVVDVFKNTAKKDKFSHAYLFYGPRGTGKTTTARLIAKIANCSSRELVQQKGEPCNKCSVCKEIDEGRAMDVIEIDAASNRGIDEIRGLKDSIRFSPTAYRYKVFVIDEAHMLTKEAFNALLKVLEEPPSHAIIILATTEYEKIPSTITSRAQRFHLKRLSLEEILKKLKKIIAEEKLKVSDEAIELIAAAAEGGLRDAESLLDQVLSLTDSADLKSVESIIGRVGFKRVFELADSIVRFDLKKSLQQINNLCETGANISDLNKELINYFRKALSLKLNPDLESFFQKELTKDELAGIKAHAQLINVEKQVSLLKSLIRSYSEARYSPFPHVPLEIAIIENLGHN